MKIWFEGVPFEANNFFSRSELKPIHPFLHPVFEFWTFWNSEEKTWMAHTSGSTSEPKKIAISRAQIEVSAKATLEFFKLDSESDGLVLCLSASHIGGLMILARAFLGNLDLLILAPSSNPLPENEPVLCKRKWFISLVPPQMDALLGSVSLIRNSGFWKGILLGGASVSGSLIQKLKKLKCPVYQSYGMTETVSHIAIRTIHFPENPNFRPEVNYTVLPNILIRQNESDCICIKGEVTQNQWIETKDQIQRINLKSFHLIGRIDDIVNSGGLKINPSEIKQFLQEEPLLHEVQFELLGIKDDLLGQKLVLVFQENLSEDLINPLFWKTLIDTLKSSIDSKKLPKAVFSVKEFPKTESQKLNKPLLISLLGSSLPVWKNPHFS